MTKTPDPRTFVLVHGAGHGAWAWRRVSDLLRAAGHRVFAPTLTGLAERSHLMRGDITLETHIQDVANLFQWEDIERATLVAHSYGGWVVTGAAERLEGKLAALAYVDAFLPDEGQRGYDLLNPQQKAQFDEARAKGEASRPGPTSTALRIQRPADAAWVDAHITPQPLGVSMQAVRINGAIDRVPLKLYIRTPLFPQPVFDASLARCQADPAWRTAVMAGCGHDPMIDDPEALVALLESLA